MSTLLLALSPILLLTGSVESTSLDDESITLWENLRYGMPKSEVKALYPKYKATILNDCPVRVLSTYTKSKLKAVILVNAKNSPACADRVKFDLESKFGPPSRIDVLKQPKLRIFIPGGSVRREDRIWDIGGRRIVLATFPGVHDGYNVVYARTPSSSAPVTAD